MESMNKKTILLGILALGACDIQPVPQPVPWHTLTTEERVARIKAGKPIAYPHNPSTTSAPAWLKPKSDWWGKHLCDDTYAYSTYSFKWYFVENGQMQLHRPLDDEAAKLGINNRNKWYLEARMRGEQVGDYPVRVRDAFPEGCR